MTWHLTASVALEGAAKSRPWEKLKVVLGMTENGFKAEADDDSVVLDFILRADPGSNVMHRQSLSQRLVLHYCDCPAICTGHASNSCQGTISLSGNKSAELMHSILYVRCVAFLQEAQTSVWVP